ncbi:MAG: hypothetical protein ABIB79_04475 [archaeon]
MIDFTKIKTVSLKDRESKFHLEDMVPLGQSAILSDNENLRELASSIKEARAGNYQFILMMGAHSIKLGLSLFLIDLMQKRIITHLATNGAGAIHDFELAYAGATSEDVQKNLEDGSFGMADETGEFLSLAARTVFNNGSGLGYAIGALISDSDLKYKEFSLFYNAYQLGIPITVHTAIGAEIIYQHPKCDPAALGKSSHDDFKILTNSVSKLEKGVVINLGSAVMMPEVFLKSLALARNLGKDVRNFTATNLDMVNHYRPGENVVERPTSLGGKGYNILERHEKSVPTLHKLLTKV